MSGKPLSACVGAAALGSALILAQLSWRFMEAPVLRLRRLFPARD
jgi:peptidoglycan/LPS O-acetylase OafA/YrhL